MTIRRVDFISRAKAEALADRADLVVISITEPESTPARLALPEDRVLRLMFHDVDEPSEDDTGSAGSWVLFDLQQAAMLIRFVRNLDAAPHDLDLVVHGRAGISRSAAVALYVEAATGCLFPRKSLAGFANQWVLMTLAQCSGLPLKRPIALPKWEQFWVTVVRNFEGEVVTVITTNLGTRQMIDFKGPLLEVLDLAAAGIGEVAGIRHPPPAHQVRNWDELG